MALCYNWRVADEVSNSVRDAIVQHDTRFDEVVHRFTKVSPETSTKAEAAGNVAYINYGAWLCKDATGYWAKPARIQVDVSPPGLTRVNVNNSWAKVNVHLNVRSEVVAEIHCPHPIAALRFWGITQHVGPISGARVFRRSGESHWF